MSEEIITGCFVKTPCCTECDWFSWPLLIPLNGFLVPPRTVCPDCGANVVEMAGKYKVKVTTGFFGGKTNNYIDFIRRETVLDVPKPNGPIQT